MSKQLTSEEWNVIDECITESEENFQRNKHQIFVDKLEEFFLGYDIAIDDDVKNRLRSLVYDDSLEEIFLKNSSISIEDIMCLLWRSFINDNDQKREFEYVTKNIIAQILNNGQNYIKQDLKEFIQTELFNYVTRGIYKEPIMTRSVRGITPRSEYDVITQDYLPPDEVPLLDNLITNIMYALRNDDQININNNLSNYFNNLNGI
jgi:hypothetical protein